MILYLTKESQINLLDFPEQELPVKKLTGSFSLLSFVVKDMRHFSHVRYLVLNRSAIMESDEDLIQALLSYQTMYDMRVVIIAEGMPQNSPFVQQLIQLGIVNIVTAIEIDEIQNQLTECLSNEGMQRFMPPVSSEPAQDTPGALFEKKDQYQFNCTNLRIAVAGSDRRVGTTTTAMNLVSWINRHGGKACYVESNTHYHLPHIIQLFQPQKSGNAYVLEGSDFYLTSELNGEYNFVVLDCGVLHASTIQEPFKAADIRLLCGSALPYELVTYYKVLERCKGLDVQALGMFVPESLKPYLVEQINSDMLFMEPSHDLFDTDHNYAAYLKVLDSYILK
ncbi:hypothetical protein ABEW32_20575 [Paenibacillus jamilae]|uniref:hypothetical protein n=1 Tax=Paenibacillus jamilae TaxID=114136 RepID=UPI003D2DECA5